MLELIVFIVEWFCPFLAGKNSTPFTVMYLENNALLLLAEIIIKVLKVLTQVLGAFHSKRLLRYESICLR